MPTLKLALVLALAAGPAAAPARPAAQAAEAYTAECTFSHPAYSGHCVVSEETPRDVAPQAACEKILECLNDTRCTAKSYCNATTLRGGWKLEAAKEKGKP